jgi:hypothetical protein
MGEKSDIDSNKERVLVPVAIERSGVLMDFKRAVLAQVVT